MTLQPPKDLPSGPTILRTLVVPFDEAILPPHKDAGHRFTWATVRVPADPEAVSLNVDHDSSEVGMIVAAVKRQDGLWCGLKVGLRAERLIRAGYVGVSPEISEDGELPGVALCVKGHAGLPSARIVDSLPSFSSAEAPAERASVPSFPPIGLGSGKAPAAPAEFKSALAWGQVGESKTIIGTGAKASDSPGSMRSTDVPSPFAGRLSTPDPELEAEAARRRFEEIRAGRKAWAEWPETFLRQHRKNYQILCEQFEEERARDAAEQLERARDAELEAAIEAIMAPQPKRWWQWWRS